MTLAHRIAAVLSLLAGLFAAWACARAGAASWALLACAIAGAAVASQVFSWTRSRRHSPLVLERRSDGRLQVRQGTGRPMPVSLGAQTRLLGPSVYLDFTFASGPQTVRCLRWITVCDAPAHVLRRWSVLLPSVGSLGS